MVQAPAPRSIRVLASPYGKCTSETVGVPVDSPAAIPAGSMQSTIISFGLSSFTTSRTSRAISGPAAAAMSWVACFSKAVSMSGSPARL